MSTAEKTGNFHTFAKVHFNYPTFCDYCGEFIWGLGKQGYSCRVCRFASHKRCIEYNPPTCNGTPLRPKTNTSFIGPAVPKVAPVIDTNSCYLIVEVFEARELNGKTKTDCYCTLDLNSMKYRTMISQIEQTGVPNWNEKFAFAIQQADIAIYKTLTVTLIERNRWSTDVRVGASNVNVQPFFDSENAALVSDAWHKFDGDRVRDLEIHLKIWMARTEDGNAPPILQHCQILSRNRTISQRNLGASSPGLPSRSDPNLGDIKPEPEVFSIIKSNDINAFMTWIETANEADINEQDQFSYTPLTYACSVNANEVIINRLLEFEGINVRIASRDGNTALHYFCQKFESPDCMEPFKAFIKKRADVNAKNINGETPLFKAIFNRSIRLILVDYLLENGADVNILNPHNEGVLHYAVRLGREDLVSALINAGADITVRGKKELKTPYELAVVYNDKKMANHLRSVQELIDWLTKHNLMKYKLNFFKKELFLSKFATVTESTLDDMGIMDQAERATVLAAIREVQPAQANGSDTNVKAPEGRDEFRGEFNDDASSSSSSEIGDAWVIPPDTLEYTKKLGSGASGDVYKGIYNRNQKVLNVAIKVLKELNTEKEKEEFMKEFQVMCAVRTPHLVHFYGVTIKPKLSMVMELCSRGSVYDILQDESVFIGWDRTLAFAIGATSGVVDLHSHNPEILHRDLKSLNLLVTESFQVRLCDFGLSRFNQQESNETLQKVRGTMAYCAPETYFGIRYTTKADVYSLGMITWELVSRCLRQRYERPYQEYPNLKMDFQIIIQSAKNKLRPTIPSNTPRCLQDIITRCFSPEPENRPSSSDLLASLQSCVEEYQANTEQWNALIFQKT